VWTKDEAGAYSVSPPSHRNGIVYAQVCAFPTQDHRLLGLDARTGNAVFQAAFGAQGNTFLAPTLFDSKLYMNGGTFGGMYGFDARTGGQLWFLGGLPQYDLWTPGVDNDFVYSYVGEQSPRPAGLYVGRRGSGANAFVIEDPGYIWNGYQM